MTGFSEGNESLHAFFNIAEEWILFLNGYLLLLGVEIDARAFDDLDAGMVESFWGFALFLG